MKINLGAGNDIKPGYINHDLVYLPGIDVVHNLNQYPWPWKDGIASEIIVKDVLEHLDELIPALEEIYRILSPSGIAFIKVPYWNGWSRHADPTHKRGFHELTFHFFDPTSPYCKNRHYYSSARFLIEEEIFILAPLSPYFYIPGLRELRVSSPWAKRIVGLIGNSISNIILDLEIVLKKL
jgi:SAM-dependent methyltransferase